MFSRYLVVRLKLCSQSYIVFSRFVVYILFVCDGQLVSGVGFSNIVNKRNFPHSYYKLSEVILTTVRTFCQI